MSDNFLTVKLKEQELAFALALSKASKIVKKINI
jgi:hypothetical protein